MTYLKEITSQISKIEQLECIPNAAYQIDEAKKKYIHVERCWVFCIVQ